MKGEKGICSAGTGAEQVRRTKYDTKKHAQEARNFHVGMNFAPADYAVYHCSVCDAWHFGKPEWIKLYSK